MESPKERPNTKPTAKVRAKIKISRIGVSAPTVLLATPPEFLTQGFEAVNYSHELTPKAGSSHEGAWRGNGQGFVFVFPVWGWRVNQ